MVDEFYKKLAAVKNSPRVWQLSLPVLVIIAMHLTPGYLWWLCLIGVVGPAVLVPDSQEPEAQRVHYFIAYIFTAWLGGWGFLYLPIALFIEGWWDPKYESDPFWWGGFTDMASYSVGAWMGWMKF